MIWAKEETMSRAEIEAIQLSRLKDTVNRVYEKVPAYRAKMEEAGVRPEHIQTLKDLQKLPFVTKQDMRDNYPYGLFAVPKKELRRIHASSGTTGKPTVVGYTENDLLPLSLDTAELMYGSDFTVYLIRPGENPEMVFDETDFDNHDGLFAVPREEWEASPDFDDAIQNRLREEEQQRREAAFLDHQGDCFALYQLHRGPELRDLRDISLERLRAEGASPRKGNYDLVYTAPLTGQGDTLQ